jgi:hypothetical protein
MMCPRCTQGPVWSASFPLGGVSAMPLWFCQECDAAWPDEHLIDAATFADLTLMFRGAGGVGDPHPIHARLADPEPSERYWRTADVRVDACRDLERLRDGVAGASDPVLAAKLDSCAAHSARVREGLLCASVVLRGGLAMGRIPAALVESVRTWIERLDAIEKGAARWPSAWGIAAPPRSATVDALRHLSDDQRALARWALRRVAGSPGIDAGRLASEVGADRETIIRMSDAWEAWPDRDRLATVARGCLGLVLSGAALPAFAPMMVGVEELSSTLAARVGA